MELLGTTADTCLLFRASLKLQWAVSGWIYFFGMCLYRIDSLNPLIWS